MVELVLSTWLSRTRTRSIQVSTSSWALSSSSASIPCTIPPIPVSVLPQPNTHMPIPTNHLSCKVDSVLTTLVVCSISLTCCFLTDNSCIPKVYEYTIVLHIMLNVLRGFTGHVTLGSRWLFFERP